MWKCPPTPTCLAFYTVSMKWQKSKESGVFLSFKPYHPNLPFLTIHYWSGCSSWPRKRKTKIERDDGRKQRKRTTMTLPPRSIPAVNVAEGWDWRQTCYLIQMCGWILRKVIKRERWIKMLQKGNQKRESHVSPAALLLVAQASFCSKKMPPALVCLAASWQKWWLPWMLFWAGLDTGATHTAVGTHYTWKHPGLWAQHTHTHTHTHWQRCDTASPSCHSELFWRQLSSHALESSTPDLSSFITGVGCRQTHICTHTHTHTHTHSGRHLHTHGNCLQVDVMSVRDKAWTGWRGRARVQKKQRNGKRQKCGSVPLVYNSVLLPPGSYFHIFRLWYMVLNITLFSPR